MKKVLGILLILSVTVLLVTGTYGQNISTPQKYALVIGNGAYTNISRLNNPVNDANDIAAALRDLGFTVDTVLNGSLDQMENANIRLNNRLSVTRNSYGFLFYAGHGVQFNGENYLIPVDANIQSDSFLRQRTVSVQAMLDELNAAGNELNIIVLDACRDNPFGWNRSGSRGLSLVANQPADSIIVYATAAGSTAADGTGRNGLFTEHFLNHLKTPGLEVTEMFRLTMGDVSRVSNNQQRPAIYHLFPGIAYLGTRPSVIPQAVMAIGSISVTSGIAGEILLDGSATGIRIREGGTVIITNASSGNTEVAVREDNGQITKAPQIAAVRQGQTAVAVVERPASVQTVPTAVQPTPAPVYTDPFISPSAGWRLGYTTPGATGSTSVRKEFIDGRERDVLNMEVRFQGSGYQQRNFCVDNPAAMIELRRGSGVRFKVLGDGQTWEILFHNPNGSGGNFWYGAAVSTRRNRVVEITIPYTRLSRGNFPRFEKSNIYFMEFFRGGSLATPGVVANSTLKVFDFEVLP